MDKAKPFRIGMLLFPGLTQLDVTAPFEVFARMPNTEVVLIGEDMQSVKSDRGLMLMPDATFDSAIALDLLFVPGGPGQVQACANPKLLQFVKEQDKHTSYTTSVCTGSLVLAAAGLLQGRKATTHWASMRALELMGAKPLAQPVVEDGKYITGAGVVNGIDLGLYIAEKIGGKEAADRIQVMIELQPEKVRRIAPENIDAIRNAIKSSEPVKSLISVREEQARLLTIDHNSQAKREMA